MVEQQLALYVCLSWRARARNLPPACYRTRHLYSSAAYRQNTLYSLPAYKTRNICKRKSKTTTAHTRLVLQRSLMFAWRRGCSLVAAHGTAHPSIPSLFHPHISTPPTRVRWDIGAGRAPSTLSALPARTLLRASFLDVDVGRRAPTIIYPYSSISSLIQHIY